MEYFFTHSDLQMLVQNNEGPYYCFLIKEKSHWQYSILNHLLKAQPELKAESEDFLEKLASSKHPSYTLFANIFKDKIKLSAIGDYLFTVDWGHKKIDTPRTEFFKSLHDRSQEFLPLLHKHANIKGLSTHLFGVYVDILKSGGKNLLPQDEILKNISRFSTDTNIAWSKKKINAFMSLFDNNKELFDIITTNMKSSLASAAIWNFWETKLKHFPSDAKVEKKEVSAFNESTYLKYYFSISHEYLISEFGMSTKTAEHFAKDIQNSIRDNLRSDNKYNFESGDLIAVECKQQTSIDKLSVLCNKIVTCLAPIKEGYDFSKVANNEPFIRKFIENIDTHVLKQSLSQSLSEKVATKKVKI